MSDQSLNVIVKLTDQASGGLKSLAWKFDDMKEGLDGTTGKAQTFTKAVTAVGVAAWTYAVVKFAEFEKGMSGVKAVTQATGEEFTALGEKAKQIGKDTQFTQSEIAAAMEELGKNGLSASQILDGAADSTAMLAAAAGTSLASAATIASDAMNVYNIEAEDMKDVTNSIVGVANASKFSVEDFGLALSQGGGVARQAGVSFDDFTGTIAAVASGFQSGSDAGTSLKTFIQSLVPASDNAAAAMESIWFSAYDAAGNMKSMEDIAQNLQDGLAGLSEEQKNYTLKTIFGSDASRIAGLMAEQGAKGIKKMKDTIANTDAEEQAKIRMDNLSGSWEKLMGTVDVIAVNVGAALGDYLRPAIDAIVVALEDLTAWWGTLSPDMQDVIIGVGAVVGVMAGLAFAVGAVGLVLGPILSGFSMMAWVFSAIMAAGSALVGVIPLIAAALGPVGLVIAGVVVAAGLLYAAWNSNFLGIRDITMNVINAVSGFFENLGSKAFDVVQSITTFFSDAWNSIASTAQSVWDGITNIFTTIGQVWLAINLVIIEGILNLFWTSLAEVITTVINIWESVKSFTQTAWDAITAVLGTAWGAIKLVFSTALGVVKGVFQAGWDTIKAIVTTMSSAVGGVVSTMWEGITGFFSKGIDSASKAWSNFSQGLANVMYSTWENIKNTIAAGINWIIDKANAIIRSINSATETVGFRISEIPRVAFQTGGIVPGGVNPANHDKVYTALDPGELILNRAQQSNIAAQLEGKSGGEGGWMTVVIRLENNTFHGADPAYAEQIADMVFSNFNKHQALPSF